MQQIVKFEEAQITTLQTTIAKELNQNEFHLFLMQCQRTGLDPFSRQIYGLKMGGKLTIMTSIDGLRIIAERSGQYAGQTPTQWCDKDGKWVDVWLSDAPPIACRVGVLRKDFQQPLYAIAKFSSYAQNSPIWKKMPELMLAKCAESLALRKAFPNDLSGLYSDAEMQQAQEVEFQEVVQEDKPLPDLSKLQSVLKTLDFISEAECEALVAEIGDLPQKGVDKAINQFDMPVALWDEKFLNFVENVLDRKIDTTEEDELPPWNYEDGQD